MIATPIPDVATPIMAADVIVIGAGSGGIGAAISAARLGLQVILLEAAATIGGTAANALVSSWEPGVGGTSIPAEIFARLQRTQDAHIWRTHRHVCADDPELSDFPGGEGVMDPTARYCDTLQRCGAPAGGYPYAWSRQHWRGVAFNPETYQSEVYTMLVEAGVQVVTKCRIIAVERQQSQVCAVQDDQGRRWTARTWIDATAQVHIAALASCALRHGQDARATFGEPGAPECAQPTRINGVSLVVRLRPQTPVFDPGPMTCWWAANMPMASWVPLPDGSLIANPLPLMTGSEWVAIGSQAGRSELELRALAWFQYIQHRWPEFRGWRIDYLAPAVGVREGPRIQARQTLTVHGILAGISGQTAFSQNVDTIGIADHAFDTHGVAGLHGELREPYGIPYGVLLPLGVDNLLVACRGAGFSSLAASSCRLSRTMMQLGQAAGVAAAIAQQQNQNVTEVLPQSIRAQLIQDGVQLAWPMEDSIRQRLATLGL